MSDEGWEIEVTDRNLAGWVIFILLVGAVIGFVVGRFTA